MRSLRWKYHGGRGVEEDLYKVDLALLDRYQAVSIELLRLSMLAISGYSFLILHIAGSKDAAMLRTALSASGVSQAALAGGAVAFAISASAALGHRYFTTDCFTHFVRQLRLKAPQGISNAENELPDENFNLTNEMESFEVDLKRCHWLLVAACLALAGGVILSVAGFLAVLELT